MEKSLSRRDFLKLAGLFTGSSLLAAAMPGLNNQEGKLSDNEKFSLEALETEDAMLYLFFEKDHSLRPEYSNELSDIGVIPDVHFVELVLSREVEKFQDDIPSTEILYWNSYSKDGDLYAPFLDASTIVSFSKNNVLVAYEGVRDMDDSTFFDKALDVSREIVDGIGLEAGSALKSVGLDDELKKISSSITDAKTEDFKVTFRNVLMARKLAMLSEYYHDLLGRKPVISASVGFLHKDGVLGLVRGRFQDIAKELEKMSDSSLLRCISENGGIVRMCTTLVIGVKETVVNGKDERTHLRDERMISYLKNRFKTVGVEEV